MTKEEYYKELESTKRFDAVSRLGDHTLVFKDGIQIPNCVRCYKDHEGFWNAEQLQIDDKGEIVITRDGDWNGILSKNVFNIKPKYNKKED